MHPWTLVLEAVGGSLAAIRVDEQDYRRIDVALADGDVATLSHALGAVVDAEGTRPSHLVFVVPGDVAPERFADLGEAVRRAGLPDPSWLPDAVAMAGVRLAARPAGTAVMVIDARGDEVAVWSVRAADDGVEISRDGAVDLTGRLDALVAGVVHAKLAVVAPGTADTLRRPRDEAGRRDAAYLRRELREARRIMGASDGDELVVTAGEAEVALTRAEFDQLVGHALRETIGDAVGHDEPGAETVVVSDRVTPLVEQLSEACHATVLSAPAETTALDGAAALVLPRPAQEEDAVTEQADDPTPTDGIPFLVLPHRPATREPVGARVAPGRPPRWAVPALSALLVLTLAGATTVLVTAPDPEGPTTGVASPIVPVGLDRTVDEGR